MTTAFDLSDKKRLLLSKLLQKRGLATEETPQQRIPRRVALEPAPLSFGQQRLWFLHQLDPQSTVYNIVEAVRLVGPLDTPSFERALVEVVRRHEALRTVFLAVDGQPVQAVAERMDLPLPRIDLAALPERTRAGEAARLAAALSRRTFDLARGPLLGAALLRLEAAEHVLVLVMHHIASDGWSMGVLVRELTALYGAFSAGRRSPLPELPIQYPDFAVWQRDWLQGEALESQLRFWRERLAGAPAHLDLPTDRPRPIVQSFRGARQGLVVDRVAAAALRSLSQACGATLFMTLTAALGALLHRYTGQDDVLLGTPIAGRHRPETEALVGFFVNTLVLRVELAADPGFPELLERVRETALQVDAHQDLPFEKLVESLDLPRDLSRTPLFQVLLVYQNLPQVAERPQDLAVRPFGVEVRTAQFELSVALTEREQGIFGNIDYRTDLFDPSTVRRLARHFEALLRGVAQHPDRAVSELPLLSDAELQQVVRELNGAADAGNGQWLCHQLFEAQAERTPEAPAVVSDSGSLTYRELEQRADALACRLRRLGIGPESRVGLCCERSSDALAAMLGVLKAGGAYVPLDPESPRERLAAIVADAGVDLLLTQERLAPSLAGLAPRVLAIDADLSDPSDLSDVQVSPDNAAYVIYTSGSTGVPKGVVTPHRAVVSFVQGLSAAVGLGPGDRLLLFAPLSFDASVLQIFPALASGAAVVVHRNPRELANHEILGFCERHGVTVLDLPAALLRQWVEDVAARRLPLPGCLRAFLTGGESVPVERLKTWAGLTDRRLDFFSSYGPTEATVTATVFQTANDRVEDLAGANLPIGRPLPAARAYVLDRRTRPVPFGVPGELFLGGAGLARGYLGRPGPTAASFVPDSLAEDNENGGAGGRLYRTGDLARWLPSGQLEFLGRTDHQVKIRGFRLEPAEVESALLLHPALREAAVLLREDRPGDKRLAAYVVAHAAPPTAGELRDFLAARLPQYMVPAAFVSLPALPVLASGKVDRAALPVPEMELSDLAGDYAAPRTPGEELLAGIWSQILGLERVGAHDDFFAVGGHSLLATQVASRVRDAFGVELPLRVLFESPTLAGLAAQVEEAQRAGAGVQAPPIVPVPRDAPGVELPLSFAQQRLWFLHQLDPESPVYNQPATFRLRGPFSVPALSRALTEIVRRHETLRTTFAAPDGRPVQSIAPPAPQLVPVVDLRSLPDGVRERTALRLAAEEAARPFDLSRLPVVRARLLRLGDEDQALLFTLHHISSDGWSMDVLRREVVELYEAYATGREPRLPELPVQYADFARWQRDWLQGEVLDTQLRYWRDHLVGAPAVLELPVDRPRPPAQTYRGGRRSRVLPAGLARSLVELGRREMATPFMTLLAAFQVLLHRYTGQDAIVVGTPIANRNRSEVEGLIGFFVNTLALRADLGDDPGFRTLLHRVREASLGGYAHQDLPFEKLVDELQPQRDMSRSPIFQVLFVHQAAPPSSAPMSGVPLEPFGADTGVARYDLTLACVEQRAGMLCDIDFNVDLFDPESADRMARLFVHLLAGIAADPDAAVSDLPLLDEAERAEVVHRWNETRRELSGDLLLHRLFEAQAERAPAALAVVAEGESLTYRELEQRASRLARHLRRLGVGPESRVGICCERSPDALAAMLGVLKTGGAYVPLDPESPGERLAAIAADAGLDLVLTQDRLAASLQGLPARMLRVDADRADLSDETEQLDVQISPDNAAYVIYTSGSTGTPKGVVAPHRGVVNFVHGLAGEVGLGPGDRLLVFAPLSFDASVLQIFPTLASGATVVLHRNPRELASHEILDFCARFGVTVLDLPAALLRQWVEDVAALRLPLPPCLRAFLTGGESVPVARLRTWAGLAGRPLSFLSSYGPTEASVTSTVFVTGNDPRQAPDGMNLPIGRPLPNTRAYVLDRRLRPVPRGVPGELFIAGAGLTRGYLGRPDATAEVFLPDSLAAEIGEPGGRLYRTGDLARWRTEGHLEFLGRADHQVKIRGFRLELGEVEAALRRHPALRETVVLLREDRPGDRRLVAYLSPREGAEPPPVGELRSFLAERLPHYMVPSAFVTLPALPVLASGKVDRAALPAPDAARPELEGGYAAPRTAEEELLAGIWAQVLGVERVGIHDNFFELGGDSILSIQIIARANQAGLHLTAKQLFEHQTVAELAQSAESATAVVAEQGTVSGPVPLTPIMHWFFEQGFANLHHFNQAVMLAPREPLVPGALDRAAAMLFAHHDALRLQAVRDAGSWRLENAASEPSTPFVWIDLGQVPAAERAAALYDAASQLQAGFDLASGPLACLALFDVGEGTQRLLWVMHHLVGDGVSWRVLQEDLERAYRQAAADEPPALPPKTTSFKAWAERLLAYAGSEELHGELEHWLAIAGAAVPRLPLDAVEGPGLAANTVESGRSVALALTPKRPRPFCRRSRQPTGRRSTTRCSPLWRRRSRPGREQPLCASISKGTGGSRCSTTSTCRARWDGSPPSSPCSWTRGTPRARVRRSPRSRSSSAAPRATASATACCAT